MPAKASKKTTKAEATASNGITPISLTNALTNNKQMSIGTESSPLTVVFPKSDYDEGKSVRMTLSAEDFTAECLAAGQIDDCKFPITFFKNAEGASVLQLGVKAIDSDQVVVFENGQQTSLTDANLKRGDKVSIIVRPFQYVNRKISKANPYPAGMSIQVWAVKVLERSGEAKAVMPTRLYSADDF